MFKFRDQEINENGFPISAKMIINLSDQVIQILKKEPTLIKFKPPAKIFGSIFGQQKDLLRFFEKFGVPDKDPGFGQSDIEAVGYVFLGNYVDRGKSSLEVFCTLMALKLLYPREIVLLRGSHEDKFVNSSDGLATECELKLNENVRSTKSVFSKLNEVFEYLPLACLIGKKVLCVPSGIGDTLKTIDQIKNIKRPFKIHHSESISEEEKIVLDLLWSDPVDNLDDAENQLNPKRSFIANGKVVKFGVQRIKSFMVQNEIDILVRSHEPVKEGVEKFGDTNLYTIFSCTNYRGTHKNSAAFLHFKKHQNQLKSFNIDSKPGLNDWFSFDKLKKSHLSRSVFMNDDEQDDAIGPRETVTPLRKFKDKK